MTKFCALPLCCLIVLAGFSAARAATTPLEQSMKRMATAYHTLDKDLKTPDATKKADYVALAATMKTETQTSRALVPKKVAAMPQDQQAAQIADFQKSLDEMSATIDTLSADLQAANWTDASAQIAKIKEEEDGGHKKFRIPKKEAGAPAATLAPAPAVTPAPSAPATPPGQ